MKFTLLTATLLYICSITVTGQQADSSHYDIGYATLNKAFTQHVTIRGEDLEKMPFVNLTEAIRVWLFGAYTTPVAISYVVDGNPVADVNIYPIYDIESVTWIGNAVATAAYGNTQRELVLVSTRRGKRASGMRVAAQAGFVKDDVRGDPTNTAWYHQYYLSAYENLENVSFGVSADWQRDILPQLKNENYYAVIPDNLQRWRLNGWLDWRPDAENTISFKMGYAPQKVEGETVEPNYGPNTNSADIRSHLAVPRLSWEGSWLPGLRNKLDAEYLRSSHDAYYTNSPDAINTDASEETIKNQHLVIRDHLSYTVKAGKWQIVPALDVSYHHIDERTTFIQYQENTTAVSYSDTIEQKGSLFYLTPAVDLTLSRALDINVGLMVNASGKIDTSNRRFFPFVTAAVDLLHLASETGTAALKVFGSYARRPALYIDDYTLPDFAGGGGSQNLFDVYYGRSGYYYFNGVAVQQTFAETQPACWTWQTGAEYASANGLLTLQYSYERRKLSLIAVNNNSIYDFEPWVMSFHHADVRIKVVDEKRVKWLTGINVTLLRGKADTAGYLQNAGGFYEQPLGDAYPAKYSWTGGWVNRLTVGGFTAGLDVVYHRGLATSTGYSKNTAAVPNIYAGYKFVLPNQRQLELFIESRGLIMNTYSEVADGRRYYTIGGSFSL